MRKLDAGDARPESHHSGSHDLGASHASQSHGDEGHVWFDLTPCSGVLCEGTPGLWRVPKAGGAATRLSDSYGPIVVGATTVCFSNPAGNAMDLFATAKIGGAATRLDTVQELASGLAVDGTNLYFMQYKQFGNFNLPVLSEILNGQAIDLSVSAPEANISAGPGFSGGSITLDTTSIYLRDPQGVSRFARTGGTLVRLARSCRSGIDLFIRGPLEERVQPPPA